MNECYAVDELFATGLDADLHQKKDAEALASAAHVWWYFRISSAIGELIFFNDNGDYVRFFAVSCTPYDVIHCPARFPDSCKKIHISARGEAEVLQTPGGPKL